MQTLSPVFRLLAGAGLITIAGSLGCTNARASTSGDGQAQIARSPANLSSCSASQGNRTPEQRKLYRVDFVLSSNDVGKSPTTSAYSLNLEEHSPGEISMGSNIALSANARQDVGLRIRSSFIPVDDNLLLETSLELSASDEPSAIRKITARGTALLLPGKESLVASLEDPVSHKHYQLTAMPSKLR